MPGQRALRVRTIEQAHDDGTLDPYLQWLLYESPQSWMIAESFVRYYRSIERDRGLAASSIQEEARKGERQSYHTYRGSLGKFAR